MYSQISKDYLVATIGAVLRQDKVPEPPKELDFKEFYRFAKFHCVENIVYHALEQIEIEGQEELLAKWAQNRDGNIFKLMTQLGELERLSAAFEEMKIKHIPLKGPLLLDYYPQFDFRYMGDIDLIIPKEEFTKVSDFMKSQDYYAKEEDLATYHQEYIKKINGFESRVEIHDDIMPDTSPYYPIMKDYWSWVNLVDNTFYRYQMPVDQFYLHILTHLAKHYEEEGTGIRSVMDIYVLKHALADRLDNDFLNSQLERVGLLEFRMKVEQLAELWFTDSVLSEELQEMADYFLSQGAFGSYGTRAQHRMENFEGSKFSYILSRIFHNRKGMERRYPVLKKMPFLLPLFWLYRIFDSLLNPKWRKLVKEEFSQLKRFDKQ